MNFEIFGNTRTRILQLMDLMESSGDQAIVEERQKLIDTLDKVRVSVGSSSSNFKKPVTNDSGTGVVYAPAFGV